MILALPQPRTSVQDRSQPLVVELSRKVASPAMMIIETGNRRPQSNATTGLDPPAPTPQPTDGEPGIEKLSLNERRRSVHQSPQASKILGGLAIRSFPRLKRCVVEFEDRPVRRNKFAPSPLRIHADLAFPVVADGQSTANQPGRQPGFDPTGRFSSGCRRTRDRP